VKKNGAVIATFVYDGDGRRVKATFGGSTTVYIGDYYEQTGSTIRKYPSAPLRAGYYANGRRVAMRENSTVYYLPADGPSFATLRTGLGSTAITTDSSGTPCPPCRGAVPPQGGRGVAELRYKAWGETRYTWGTTPTTYRFTGQREDATIGLYFYNARYYDPVLGRFIAPDTVVPELGGAPSANIARMHESRGGPFVDGDPNPRRACARRPRPKSRASSARTTRSWYRWPAARC